MIAGRSQLIGVASRLPIAELYINMGLTSHWVEDSQ
jgi:hypothetical protein